ncbi:MAG: UTRA domain-containing protein [Mangrovibacterium sp.]
MQKPQIKPWPNPFPFEMSDAEKDSGCIYMERLRFVNSQPVFYDINHLPNINLPRFTSRTFENKSLFDILRLHYQIEVKGGEQKLKALKASKTIGKLLNIKEGDPVLYVERKLFYQSRRVQYLFDHLFQLGETRYFRKLLGIKGMGRRAWGMEHRAWGMGEKSIGHRDRKNNMKDIRMTEF